MTSIETATTIPLPVAQMTPPSKVPHSPICSSPESIDAGFYDIEVGSNLTSNNASSINGDEYQLVSVTFYQPVSLVHTASLYLHSFHRFLFSQQPPQQVFGNPQQYEVKFEVNHHVEEAPFTEADLNKLSELVGVDDTWTSNILELQPQPNTPASELLQDLSVVPSVSSPWAVTTGTGSEGCYVDLSGSHYSLVGHPQHQPLSASAAELPLLEFEMSETVESSLNFVH